MFSRILNLRFIFTRNVLVCLFVFLFVFELAANCLFWNKKLDCLCFNLNWKLLLCWKTKQRKFCEIRRCRIRENMRWAKFKRNHENFTVFLELILHFHGTRERKTKNEFCFNYFRFFTKGVFFSESAIHFSNLQISKKKYSKKLSWTWNLNFPPITLYCYRQKF